jgi:hypothetical protein
MHDKILGAAISLLMQTKFVGINPPWSSAQSRAARQIEVVALAQVSDSARFFPAEAARLKMTATSTTATTTETKMMRRLLMARSSGLREIWEQIAVFPLGHGKVVFPALSIVNQRLGTCGVMGAFSTLPPNFDCRAVKRE